jgi:glycosyltransferase involved in cell wall biosynthesis
VRVLHAPVEVAGQLALSAAALRRAGVEATAYCEVHPFDYPVGPDVVPAVGRPLRYVAQTARLVARHDVVHFHFATSFFRESRGFFDARLIARRKPVFVTFHGSDVRQPSLAAAASPHFVAAPGEEDELARRRLRAWGRVTQDAVLLDPGLVPHVEPFFARVHLHKLIVDAGRVEPRFPAEDGPPVLVHSPTRPSVKGTAEVRAAVAALRGRVDFEYDELGGVPQAEAVARYARADLVVDQLLVGSYGVFALEAMALGKPVIANVVHRDADLPIIQADPGNIAEVLEHWLTDAGARRARGIASRAYVEREHDLLPAGRRLRELYGA